MTLRIFVVSFVLFTTPLLAISMYVGYMEGKVTAEDNSPLKGALVVVTPKPSEPEKGTQTAATSCEEEAKKKGSQKASTGPNGRYKFVALKPGMYKLCYGLSGYKTIFVNVEIKQAVTNAVNIVLKTAEAGH